MSNMASLLSLLGATLATGPGAANQSKVQDDPGTFPGAYPQTPADPGPPPPVGALNAGQARGDKLVRDQQKADQANEKVQLDEQDGVGKAQTEAAAHDVEFKKAQTEATKSIYKDALTDDNTRNEEFTKTLTKYEEQKEDGRNKYLAAVDDLKNTHIYSWWGQADTGARILGILSQMFAGGLQGLNGQGGPTPLDRVIEQFITTQRLNLTQKSDVAQQTGGLYRDLQAQFKDRVMAEGALRDIAYHSTMERAKAMIASQGVNPADGEKVLADIRAKIAENRMNIFAHHDKAAWAGIMAQSELGVKWGSLYEQQRGQDQTLAAHMLTQGSPVGIYGLKGSANMQKADKEGFREFKSAWDSTRDMERYGQEMEALLDAQDKGTSKLSSAQFIAKVDQRKARMTFALKNIMKLGQISGGDQTLTDEAVGIESGLKAFLAQKTPSLSSYQEMKARVDDFVQEARTYMTTRVESFDVGGQQMQVTE